MCFVGLRCRVQRDADAAVQYVTINNAIDNVCDGTSVVKIAGNKSSTAIIIIIML